MTWTPGTIINNTQKNMLIGVVAISGIIALSIVAVVVAKTLSKKKSAPVSAVSAEFAAGEAQIISTVVQIVLPLIKEFGGMALDKWDAMSVPEREAWLEKISKSKAAMAAAVGYAITTFGTGAPAPIALAALKSAKVRSAVAKMHTAEMRKVVKETGVADLAEKKITSLPRESPA